MIQNGAGALVAHRYQIEYQLGEGGMGSVYRAIDRLTGRVVALKKVSVSGVDLDEATMNERRLALATEFKLLASMHHPYVINVLDYGFDDDRQPFFTMDFIEKAETIVSHGRLKPVKTQVELVVQMLQALAYLHRRGVIHRDLKPDNVLVDDGVVQVLDFGIARMGESLPGVSGTLAYMAPELLQQTPASQVSDLYAVGVMLYELAAGAHPFRVENVNDLINDVLLSIPDFSDVMVLDEDGIALEDAKQALTQILMRLFSKDPADRYQTAYELINVLCEAANLPIPTESAEIRESYLQAAQFIGRETEFNQLVEAMQSTLQSGKGSLWMVGGESGVGKSRLLDEVRTWGLVHGMLVLRGQAVKGGGLPYQLWREPIRRLALSSNLSPLEMSILKDIVPDMDSLLGQAVSDAPQLDGPARQLRLAQTISDVLRRQSQPLVLLMEDMQWTQESLELLKQIVHIIDDIPVMIIGSYRDDERAALPDELSNVNVLRLRRFSEETIRELSVSMLGESGSYSSVLSLLHRETEGNVYFLIEVVRALAEDAGRLQDVGSITLPEHVFTGGVREVLRRRLSRIGEDAQPLIRLAAVAGRQIDLKILEEAAPDADIAAWLTTAANAAVIELIDDVWRFTHDKLREAILEGISSDELPELHRRVAKAIEWVYLDDKERAPVLAEHWHAAGDARKELHYVILAAEQTYSVSDYQDAERFGEWARSMLKDDDPRLVRVLRLLGDVQWAVSHYRGAIDRYQEALKVAKQLHDDDGASAALFGLGQSQWRQGELDLAIAANTEALALAEKTGSLLRQSDAYNGLGVATFDKGDVEKAGEYYRKSLELSEKAGAKWGIARGNNNLGNVHKFTGKFEASRDFIQRAVNLYQEIGDKQNTAFATLNLGAVKELLQDYDGAKACYKIGCKICREIGSEWGLAAGISNLGALAEIQEDYEGAKQRHLEALRLAEKLGDPYLITAILGNIVFAGLLLNDEVFSLPYLRDMVRRTHESKLHALLLEGVSGYAWLLMLRGKLERSAELAGYLEDHLDASTADIRLKPLLEKLAVCFNGIDFKPHMLRGKSLNLEDVVNEILECE